MHIAIKRVSAPRKDDHLVLLCASDKEIPFSFFSDAERKFIREERKEDRKLIIINQYSRMVYLQMVDAGKSADQRSESLRKVGAALVARLQSAHTEAVVIWAKEDADAVLKCCEGLLLASYQFLKFRSNARKEANKLKTVNICCAAVADSDIAVLRAVTTAVYHTRDLVNEPQNSQTATDLANSFVKMGKEAGFKVQVLNKAKIKSLKMGGVLAVNQGSIQPPTFTIMEWKPKGAVNKKPIVLVGKGVVYDTGGLSLKPTANSMDFMKCDMAGGATVGGAMYAIAKAKLPVHVIGLVPATDNRPDGNAYAPGDVITMMSGKTVEVLNTDAEGRLLLADALTYAKRFNPEMVLEFSTLTGAASAAIGQYGIVCMGTVNDEVRNGLRTAANAVYERLAEFPFWEEYDDLLKSDIADLKNIGGPTAGAITAGRFLQQFADFPYMHFDIAGPAFNKGNDSYRVKNGTGVGVRLVFEYLRNKKA